MIMERLQECRRMVKRTRWIDEQLMKLHSGAERTTGVLDKSPSGTGDSIVLEEQLEKITEFERHYAAQLVEAMQEIIELDDWLQQLPRRHEDVMRLRYIVPVHGVKLPRSSPTAKRIAIRCSMRLCSYLRR